MASGPGTRRAADVVRRLAGGPRLVGDTVRRRAGATPLRVKLVAALLGLVTLGLLVTGVAATTALRGYLLGRVDAQLRSAAQATTGQGDRFRGPGPRAGFDAPNAFFVQLNDATGATVGQAAPPVGAEQSRPQLPRLDFVTATRRAGRPFTVSSVGSGADWRTIVTPFPDGSGSVTVALSLAEVSRTLGRLALIDLVVSAAVLGLLAGLGYLVVRSSLRPLVEVEATAAAIAAGDLSRRVPDRDPRTEVGRLTRALNGMLAQVEAAFQARAGSEAAARASEDRMRRFVADASHELRTPLTSIRGFAELYRQGAATDPADVARVMRRVETEATRMGLLVEDLLLLARLDQQRPLERRPVDLLTIAADAVDDARAVSPGRPVSLRVRGSVAPVVLGDDARLRQVAGNLMSNAVTHTPAGTPVTVTVGSSDDGRHALLEVSDAGPGIADADRARVFERFYRADPARTRAQGGTGLGLSIVAALVAAHGGIVEVTSTAGQGATFRVRLPLATRPDDGVAPVKAPAATGARRVG